MESECHQLDLKLAQHTIGRTGDRAGFVKYSNILHELQTLEEKRERQRVHEELLDGVVTAIAAQSDNCEGNQLVLELQQEAERARLQLHELVCTTCTHHHVYN